MATDISQDAAGRGGLIALTRFGLGPKPGQRAIAEADPRGMVAAEIARPEATALDIETVLDPPDVIADVMLRRQAVRAKNLAAAAAGSAEAGMASLTPELAAAIKGMSPIGLAYETEIRARLDRAAAAEIGFAERLVGFWTNHFTVSTVKSSFIGALGGAYEREAIRPHALGRFADMLQAVARHPAMLLYLDNRTSTGPNSALGRRRPGRGLNENFARELLELHTLGPRNFGQEDVTELAAALTGWSFGMNPKERDVGVFRFEKRRHEPGPRVILGKRYPEGGVGQATAILADLARHPATARNVADRLVRAFVGTRSEALTERLARRFLDTGGDLAEVAAALVAADEAWAAPPSQLRPPMDFMLAAMRATSMDFTVSFARRSLEVLGQPIWGAPSPKGYAIDGDDWLAPDAITNRLDIAERIVARAPDVEQPIELADDLYGAALTDETRTAIRRAGSRAQAMTLFLMSPEFQRR